MNVDMLFNVNIFLAVHLPHAEFKRILLELLHLERIVSFSPDPPLVKNNEPLSVYSVNVRNNASEIDPTTEDQSILIGLPFGVLNRELGGKEECTERTERKRRQW